MESYDYKVYFNDNVVCSGSFDSDENNSEIEINFTVNNNGSSFIRSKTIEKQVFVEADGSNSDCEATFEVKDIDSNTSKKYCLKTSNETESVDCGASASLQSDNTIVVVYKRNDCKKKKIILK